MVVARSAETGALRGPRRRERVRRGPGRSARETSSRAALAEALVRSRLNSACAVATVASHSTFVAPADFVVARRNAKGSAATGTWSRALAGRLATRRSRRHHRVASSDESVLLIQALRAGLDDPGTLMASAIAATLRNAAEPTALEFRGRLRASPRPTSGRSPPPDPRTTDDRPELGSAIYRHLTREIRIAGPRGSSEPDPDTAPAARELFERRAAGDGLTELARWLDRLQMTTARGGRPTARIAAATSRSSATGGAHRGPQRLGSVD